MLMYRIVYFFFHELEQAKSEPNTELFTNDFVHLQPSLWWSFVQLFTFYYFNSILTMVIPHLQKTSIDDKQIIISSLLVFCDWLESNWLKEEYLSYLISKEN